MKKEKREKPKLHPIKIHCSCGNVFQTLSIRDKDLKVEICSHCHPLYSGNQKLVDTTGQVEKFKARLEKSAQIKSRKKRKIREDLL